MNRNDFPGMGIVRNGVPVRLARAWRGSGDPRLRSPKFRREAGKSFFPGTDVQPAGRRNAR